MGVIPGTRLGPYEILSPLGAGGMGEVYRAKDTRLDWTFVSSSFVLKVNEKLPTTPVEPFQNCRKERDLKRLILRVL